MYLYNELIVIRIGNNLYKYYLLKINYCLIISNASRYINLSLDARDIHMLSCVK